MNIQISPEISSAYPSLNVTLIVATKVKVSAANEHIESLLQQQEESVRKEHQLKDLSSHKHITSWRSVYSSFGARPSKYPCAAEFLIRTVIKRGHLPRINSIVNLGNYISVKHVLPVDIIDLDTINGDIKVLFARGNERFIQLGSDIPTYPGQGEVIYSDDTDALGRRWNWKKCDKTKITLNTRNILIILESIEDISKEAIDKAKLEIINLLSDFSTDIQIYHVSSDKPQTKVKIEQ